MQSRTRVLRILQLPRMGGWPHRWKCFIRLKWEVCHSRCWHVLSEFRTPRRSMCARCTEFSTPTVKGSLLEFNVLECHRVQFTSIFYTFMRQAAVRWNDTKNIHWGKLAIGPKKNTCIRVPMKKAHMRPKRLFFILLLSFYFCLKQFSLSKSIRKTSTSEYLIIFLRFYSFSPINHPAAATLPIHGDNKKIYRFWKGGTIWHLAFKT